MECLKKALSCLKIAPQLEIQEFRPRCFGRQITTRYCPKAQALPVVGVSPASASGPSMLFSACLFVTQDMGLTGQLCTLSR